eukprot:m.103117 g.103117  ORF g.103117 m.103117 type:complete len:351 (-) comp15211_c0_seq2:695-1747(-)
MAEPQFLVLGANPALQKTIFLPEFQPGEVNRASRVSYGFGGKGQNCSQALRQYTRDSCCVVEFLAGQAGEKIEKHLKSKGIAQAIVWCQGETRTATTLVSTDTTATYKETEIVDPSPPVSPANVNEFYDAISKLTANTTPTSCLGVAVMGSLPPDTPDDFYEACCQRVKEGVASNPNIPKTFVLLDGYRNVESLLLAGLVDLLKINFKELKKVMAWQNCEDIPELLVHLQPKHVDTLFEKFGLQGLAVTEGPRPAVLVSRCENTSAGGGLKRTVYTLPSMSVVNAIGCGDVVAAVTLSTHCSGMPLPIAFQHGLAAGCAACLTENPAQYDVAQAQQLVESVGAEPECGRE